MVSMAMRMAVTVSAVFSKYIEVKSDINTGESYRRSGELVLKELPFGEGWWWKDRF
jgi:hypothetical protein